MPSYPDQFDDPTINTLPPEVEVEVAPIPHDSRTCPDCIADRTEARETVRAALELEDQELEEDFGDGSSDEAEAWDGGED
jgi:hypothetical protein